MNNDNIKINVPIKKSFNIFLWLLFIILIALSCFSVYEYIELNEYQEELTDNSNNIQDCPTNKISLPEDMVTYLEKSIVYSKPNVIYSNSIVTSSSLSQEVKNYLTWAVANADMIDGNYTCSQIQSAEYINSSNKVLLQSGCADSNWNFENEYPNSILDYVYNVNYNQLNDAYHKVFGLECDLPKQTAMFGIDTCILKNDDLLCFRGEGGYTDGWYDIRFDSAYMYEDKIELYQYYGEDTTNKDVSAVYYNDTEFKAIAKKYVSIFKKDTNNNYYWYSTEPVSE